MHAKNYWCLAVLTVGFAVSANSIGQAPAGATGECKDGSYSKAESKRGACGQHGGIKEWYGNNNRTTEKAAAPEKSESTRATAPQTNTTANPSTNSKSNANANAGRATAATGGGPGQVWVNTRSTVYHCQTDKWYGKTMKGEYMSEADAKARGAHADHGKACS